MGEVTETQLRLNQLRKQGFMRNLNETFYDVVKNSIGLHSTDYWTPYLSVWARIGDYDASEFFKDLNSGKKLFRRPAFRNTHHIIHFDNLPLILAALGPHLTRSMRPAPPIKNLSDEELEERIAEIIDVLEEGPMSMTTLKARLPHIGNQMRWLLLMANGRGLIIRTKGTHAKSTKLDYDLVHRWVKGFRPLEMTEENARTQLALRYIELFGPVMIDDLSWWMPCKKTESKRLISNLEDQIATMKIHSKPHLITKEDLEYASSIEEPLEPTVFFLPYEDHFPKAFTNRTWYLSEDTKKCLYPRRPEHYWPPEMIPAPSDLPKGMNASGEMRPSIWLGNRVIGRWEIDIQNDVVRVNVGLISKVNSKIQSVIEHKRRDLTEFILHRLIPISGG